MAAATKRPKSLPHDLCMFTGSETKYRHWFGRLVYTEGVKHLAEEVGAYWLTDAIASHQPRVPKDDRFQLWLLSVKGGAATLVCRRDTDTPDLVRQDIEWTDFPETPEGEPFKLYVVDDCLMLPSEY
jgi:hypothetical protein